MENNTNSTKLFYCYSDRLHMFLESLGVRYENEGINFNSKHKYWVYKIEDKLQKCLNTYKTLKEEIDNM